MPSMASAERGPVVTIWVTTMAPAVAPPIFNRSRRVRMGAFSCCFPASLFFFVTGILLFASPAKVIGNNPGRGATQHQADDAALEEGGQIAAGQCGLKGLGLGFEGLNTLFGRMHPGGRRGLGFGAITGFTGFE